MKRKTIAQHMKDVLEKQGFDSVMWGDTILLDDCAELCTHTNLMDIHPLNRHDRILSALDKSKLFKKSFIYVNGYNMYYGLVRHFTIVKET